MAGQLVVGVNIPVKEKAKRGCGRGERVVEGGQNERFFVNFFSFLYFLYIFYFYFLFSVLKSDFFFVSVWT